MVQHEEMRIVDVIVPTGRREKREVAALAASMQEVGQLQPIIVSDDNILVDGEHRLEAARSLGWASLWIVRFSGDEVDRQLAEIDANLARNELTALERGEALSKRKQLYLARHPETANVNQRGGPGRGNKTAADSAAVSFTQNTSTTTGKGERTVREDVSIGEKLTDATKEVVRGTSLAEKKGALLDLTRIEDPDEQADIAQRVTSGHASSVNQARAQRLNERNAATLTALDNSGELARAQLRANFSRERSRISSYFLLLDPVICAASLDKDVDLVLNFMDDLDAWTTRFRAALPPSGIRRVK